MTIHVVGDEGDILAQLQALRAENARLRAVQTSKISFKVTEKGGVSAYGLGRFPVTLYRGQWERLLESKEALLAYIEANADRLSVKE